MEQYFASLFDSDLPFEPWVAALAWIVLFGANRRAARAARAANDAQHCIAVEDWSALRRGFEPRFMARQILFAAFVFAIALWLRGPVFVFLVGGMIVTMAYAVALNVQSILSARALARPDTASGMLTFSTPAAFRHMAHRVGGGAMACLLIGLVVAHLAPIGAAFFLAATAAGYLRRARRAAARP